ncbi:hypothetical protein MMC17_007791 [Xylographa soralifera]|nr:hypothetical protein [Xylographa soralifera]
MGYDSVPYVLLKNPFCLTTLELILNALVVGYTPASSAVRLAVLPLVSICAYLVFSVCLEATQRTVPAAVLAAHSIGFLFQYIETALLSRWDFVSRGPSVPSSPEQPNVNGQTKQQKNTPWDRLSFGLFAATSTRYVGTPYQVKGIPSFSSRDPTHVPSRLEFLRGKLLGILFCYLILDLAASSAQPDLNTVLYSPDNIPLFTRSISSEKLITRILSTLGFGAIMYSLIWSYMGLLGFIAVASGLSEPRYWPPVFGPLQEAYSLRRFWGIFWHKVQQQKMSGPASFITYSILHLPKGTQIGQLTHLFWTFFISGLMHAFSDLGRGLAWEQSGAIQFFITQVVGIVIEDAARKTFRSISGAKKETATPRMVKAIGYLWVIAFLVWSIPVWIYPSMYVDKGEPKDQIIPYSVVGLLKERW